MATVVRASCVWPLLPQERDDLEDKLTAMESQLQELSEVVPLHAPGSPPVPLHAPVPRDVLERLTAIAEAPPPPPPLPLFEADRLKIFLCTFGARGFKLKFFPPALAGTTGDHRRRGVLANPPPPLSSNTSLPVPLFPRTSCALAAENDT